MMRCPQIVIKFLSVITILSGLVPDGDCELRKVDECKCPLKRFACDPSAAGECSCIPLEWKCDGDNDCGDRSDERECETPQCPAHHFRCAKVMCIDETWRCDGENDCGDDSDEVDCDGNLDKPVEQCDASQVMCDNKKCITKSWWCDGDADCEDKSDEANCGTKACASSEFQCTNGECVALSWRCDQDFDCTDGSDEECGGETHDHATEVIIPSDPKQNCTDTEFACASGDQCVNSLYQCDRDMDCTDGSDENDCLYECSEGEFKCANRRCLSFHSRCDGLNDCGDNSDELECSIPLEPCLPGEFQCNVIKTCISIAWRCDGDRDCDDGTDEESCTHCLADQFKCETSKVCIDKSWRCDLVVDCLDKSDEANCGHCADDQFQCQDKTQCIGVHKVCNGRSDCRDHSDEPPIHSCNETVYGANHTTCKTAGCQHLCKDGKFGPICTCQTGYMLQEDLKTCVDIDECETEGSCSQGCNNTDGGYSCTCMDGYTLRPDERTCKANPPEPSLFFANRIDIRRMQPDRSEFQPILENLNNAIALDYHIKSSLMFWSDVSLDSIKCSFINGSGVKEVVHAGLESPGGVSVDWVHDLLYWTDSGTSRIEVAHLDGSHRKVLIWEELEKPRAIALHPLESLMFWTDWGVTPQVESAAMDGSQRKTLANTNLLWPNGLTIDYTRNHIYWVDAKYHIIERANLDGTGRKTIVREGLLHPFSITLFEDKLYWTDWKTKSINSVNKFTGTNVRIVKNRLHFPMGIQTYHPQRQPLAENKCRNSGCSHLCLPKPGGFTCDCQTGFTLVNETHCSDEIKEFLIFTKKTEIRRISFDARDRTDTVLPLKKLQEAVAIDWDSQYPGHIYWTDLANDTINTALWDGSQQKTIISSSLGSPTGLAIDWLTGKMYWTDDGMDRIEVSLLDGSMRAVLIYTNFDRPRDISVLPSKGLMFWTDWGDEAKIERAGMDGSNRQVIIDQNLSLPNGLAIDADMERIYWVDAGFGSISSCNLDGLYRHSVIPSGLSYPFGITLYHDMVYWTDVVNSTIYSANKYDGSDIKVIQNKLNDIMDIHYYHKNRKMSDNPCKIKNGGCSHLCLLAPSDHKGNFLNISQVKHSCHCPTGFALDGNKKTCNTVMNNFLVIARRSDVRVISLDVSYAADVKLSLQADIGNVIDVAVDPVEAMLYWSDIGTKQIMRSNLNDLQTSEVVLDAGINNVDGLTIDPFTKKIYWTDTEREIIAVSELNGKIWKILISKNLDSPRAIVVHYQSGYMYWTDWGSKAHIGCAGMDGSDQKYLITDNLMWPNGVTIDLENERLIWGDAHTELIESSNLDGTDRKVLKSSVRQAYSLSAMNGFLYWTDWQTRNVERMDLSNSSKIISMRKNLINLMGIKAVSLDRKGVPRRNFCGNNNGGCSHLCLRSPSSHSGFACACPTGVRLQSDNKTCGNLPNEYLLFTSRNTIRRVSLTTDRGMYVELPIGDLENVIAIDYHYEKQKIFFTDVFLDVIRTADMDGSNAKTIVEGNLRTMDGIAVDWIADNLYWTDTGPNSISVSRLDGSSRRVLVSTNLDEPRAIAVHPTKGLMFWTDWGAKGRIERSFLDGNARKTIIGRDIVWPNGLTIDMSGSGHIYWVDAHATLNQIETCDLNGHGRKVVVSPVPHGFSITFLRNTLYWTDWQTHTIESSTSPFETHNRQKILTKVIGLMDITVVSKDLQSGTSLCDVKKGYGGCKYLCLMQGSKKYKCVDPDNIPKPNATGVTPYVPPKQPKPTDKNNKETPVPSPVNPCSQTLQGCSKPKQNSSSFIPILLGVLFVFVILFTVVGVLLWRRMKATKDQNPAQIHASFRNQSYAAGSQCTLLTGTQASLPASTPTITNWLGVPKIGLKPKTVTKEEEVKGLLDSKNQQNGAKSNPIVRAKNSFRKSFPARSKNVSNSVGIKRSESNRSYHDHETDAVFKGLLNSPTAPAKLNGQIPIEQQYPPVFHGDLSSISSLQRRLSSSSISLSSIENDSTDSDNVISSRNKQRIPGLQIFSAKGGKDGKRFRGQPGAHPKLSVSTTHTMLSVESSGSDQNINRHSNQTSTSRVSTPDCLNDFDLNDNSDIYTQGIAKLQHTSIEDDLEMYFSSDEMMQDTESEELSSSNNTGSISRGRDYQKNYGNERRDSSPSVLLKGQHLAPFGNENKV